MILKNLLLTGGGHPVNIETGGKLITKVYDSSAGERVDEGLGEKEAAEVRLRPDDLDRASVGLNLTFNAALVFPGLINSHDHLDFNLFPMLGNRVYRNYTEWGKYIHENHKEEISKVLKVPLLLREQWGIFKNLISGVTTVVNHGERLKLKERLITVHERYQCLHSVKFEKGWKRKLNNPLKLRDPVVVHIGEGNDRAAFLETGELLRWNLLGKTLVGVHGVAMSAKQAEKFRAVVWCPESNFFLLNQTAPVAGLKKKTNILFGTDSTLTGSWNIWEHLRLARETGELTDDELYGSLNAVASKVWETNNGMLRAGSEADLVIADIKGQQGNMNAFFSIDPKDILLVLHQGEIRLFDAVCLPQLKEMELAGFSKIYIQGVCKYVQGDVPGLMEKIRGYYPEADFPVGLC